MSSARDSRAAYEWEVPVVGWQRGSFLRKLQFTTIAASQGQKMQRRRRSTLNAICFSKVAAPAFRLPGSQATSSPAQLSSSGSKLPLKPAAAHVWMTEEAAFGWDIKERRALEL